MNPESVDPAWGHFGQWWAFALWAGFFLLFLLFTPFYKKEPAQANQRLFRFHRRAGV
jgi:hypothetical protein